MIGASTDINVSTTALDIQSISAAKSSEEPEEEDSAVSASISEEERTKEEKMRLAILLSIGEILFNKF